MQTFERTRDIRHEIGAHGELSLRTLDGPVRVRGIDGGEARVRAIFLVRTADEGAADRAVEAGWLRVETLPGRLVVAVPDGPRGGLDALLRFIGTGERVRVAFDVEVPRAAAVTIDTVSGDVEADGLEGIQRYRSVSGQVRLRNAAGPVSIAGTSGDASVEGARTLGLDVTTVSGALRVQVPRLESLQVRSVSGDFDIRAALAEHGEHRVHTVSGRLRLGAAGGLTVETHGISGSVRCDVPHRLEGQAGRQVLVVGDGAAHVRFDSMSGDVRVTAWAPAATAAAADAPMTGPTREGASGADTTGSITSEDTTAEGRGSPMFQVWHGQAYDRMDDLRAEAAVDRVLRGDRVEGEQPAATGGTAAPDPRLDILRALERGEIDVDEAARRLAQADAAERDPGPGSNGQPAAPRAWQGVSHAG